MANTLVQYRQAVAKELGAFVSSTATSGTTALLTDTSSTLRSTTKSSNFYKDWYILRPAASTADKVRRVATYTPSSGSFTPDGVWAVAPAAAEAYELHGFIEPYVDLTDIINQALKRCYVPIETTITPVALATKHQIAATSVIAEWMVRRVGMLSSGESRAQVDPYQRAVRGWTTNGGDGFFYINHPGYTFNTTDTIYLWTVSRAYDQCRATGFPLVAASGLALDADTALPPVAWVTPGALVEAFERYANILEPTSSQRIESTLARHAARFSSQCRDNFQRPVLQFRPLVAMGPLPNGYAPGMY